MAEQKYTTIKNMNGREFEAPHLDTEIPDHVRGLLREIHLWQNSSKRSQIETCPGTCHYDPRTSYTD